MPKINNGHVHELLDRTHVIARNIELHLLEHPLTDTDNELYDLIFNILKEMANLYQVIGKKGDLCPICCIALNGDGLCPKCLEANNK